MDYKSRGIGILLLCTLVLMPAYTPAANAIESCWTRSPLTGWATLRPPEGVRVTTFAVFPGPNPQVLVGAVSELSNPSNPTPTAGVWLSDAGGCEWKQILALPSITARGDMVQQVEVLFTGTNWRVFATIADKGPSMPTFRYTDDLGANWNTVAFDEMAVGLRSAWSNFFVAPSNPSVAYLIASAGQSNLDLAPLLISTEDGGTSWRYQEIPAATTPRVLPFVGVAATNPKELVVITVFDPGHERPTQNQKILRSLDAGSSWETIKPPQPPNQMTGAALYSTTVSSASRQFVVWSDTFGLSSSQDGGASWQSLNVVPGQALFGTGGRYIFTILNPEGRSQDIKEKDLVLRHDLSRGLVTNLKSSSISDEEVDGSYHFDAKLILGSGLYMLGGCGESESSARSGGCSALLRFIGAGTTVPRKV